MLIFLNNKSSTITFFDLSLKTVLFQQQLFSEPTSLDAMMDLNVDNSDLYNGIYMVDLGGNLYEYSLYQRQLLVCKPLAEKGKKPRLVSTRPFKLEVGYD